jgi:Nitroreductase family
MQKLIRLSPLAGAVALILTLLISPAFITAQAAIAAPTTAALQPIPLPAPQTDGGMPLMQALNNRKTTRTFAADQPLSMQQLSNLLWAGFGINRPSMVNPGHGPASAPAPPPTPGRTAPSGQNKQDIQLYVVLAQGAYLYDPVNGQLKPVATGDLRTKIGSGAAAHAAATIVFVAPVKDDPFSQVDTGFIGQNIYLYAASEGLNAWFYAFHNQDVAGALNLPADKVPTYGESVGFPEK